jgi:hypothetical protein
MTGNPTFPTPNPPLTAVSGAVNTLQAAETAALTRATGTVATRNESLGGPLAQRRKPVARATKRSA